MENWSVCQIKCTYCSATEHKLGRRRVWPPEHFLPDALGHFRGGGTLIDKVCPKCNREIGRCEEQFLRAGPIALYREKLGLREKDSPNPFHRRSAGVDVLRIVDTHPETGYEVRWEIHGQQRVPCEQLASKRHDGTFAHILVSDWSDQDGAIRQWVEEEKRNGTQGIISCCAPENHDSCRAVVEGNIDKITWLRWVDRTERGVVTANFELTDKYYRAVAKIAFHYALWVMADLDGSSINFLNVRKFVKNGGNYRPIVDQLDSVKARYEDAPNRQRWRHILAVQRDKGEITGYCQFFNGPHFRGVACQVKLGSDPSVIKPVYSLAHEFVYHGTRPQSGFDGVARPLQVNFLSFPWE